MTKRRLAPGRRTPVSSGAPIGDFAPGVEDQFTVFGAAGGVHVGQRSGPGYDAHPARLSETCGHAGTVPADVSAQASGNRRLDASQELAGLDEPVRRYLTHALDDGAMLPSSAQLQMRGVIDPGVRLSFEATQRFDGHAFVWTARAGLGRVRPLQVVDRYDGRGQGSTEGVAFGRLRFLHADGPDTGRAAAGRAAAESVWRPWLLLPAAGVTWRAETAELIVASFDVGPERVDLNLRIAADGALRTVSLDRWGDAGRKDFGYIPFGGDVLQERRFGDWTVPSRLRVGWWYGTPRSKVFFDATVLSLAGC